MRKNETDIWFNHNISHSMPLLPTVKLLILCHLSKIQIHVKECCFTYMQSIDSILQLFDFCFCFDRKPIWWTHVICLNCNTFAHTVCVCVCKEVKGGLVSNSLVLKSLPFLEWRVFQTNVSISMCTLIFDWTVGFTWENIAFSYLSVLFDTWCDKYGSRDYYSKKVQHFYLISSFYRSKHLKLSASHESCKWRP